MSDPEVQKVHLVSLGCPKNTVDSERMIGLLQGNAYQMTDDPHQADVVVVNTCGFIEPAKEESIEAIMAAHRLKQEGHCKGVVVTGCLSTRYQEELAAGLPEADQLLTIEQEVDIVQHVDQLLDRPRATYLESQPRAILTPKHWAYLRISDGCDHQCAFCAIPAIRGRHKSESIEDLVAEASRLADQGVRELVLIAQDSVRYGADLYGRPRLVPLLQELEKVEGIDWLRLMYTYPAFWTEPMIDFYASSAKMCAYIDMPLQHIADPVLKRMKRATTKRKTIELIDRLRQRIPGVGMRSSFIVGFPGETEAQFEELLQFIEDSRFDNATGFLYSDEDGTAAFDLDGNVPQALIQERFSRLSQLQERISVEINSDLVGTRHAVLVDEEDSDGYRGRMERDAPEIDGQVHIDEGQAQVGHFVEVEITGSYPYERSARAVGAPY
ncbi:MAG: 30S ribosomal protein S12 methylthiotransferase RimO [Candidatus Latescibacteria bacterium]|nr:30S ribosomal protein S12 methylthiotransferase RimO [Candidatus Latescibacterota bacterium]